MPRPTVEVHQTTPDGWEYHGGSWRRAAVMMTRSSSSSNRTPSTARSLSPGPRRYKSGSRSGSSCSSTRPLLNGSGSNSIARQRIVVPAAEVQKRWNTDNRTTTPRKSKTVTSSSNSTTPLESRNDRSNLAKTNTSSTPETVLLSSPETSDDELFTRTSPLPSMKNRQRQQQSPQKSPDKAMNAKKNPIPVEHIQCIQHAFGCAHNSQSVDLHRDVLQVRPNATDREIRIAYFRRGRQTLAYDYNKLHRKDLKNTSLDDIEEDIKFAFQAISMAFEILTTPAWRQVYEDCNRDLLQILLLPPAVEEHHERDRVVADQVTPSSGTTTTCCTSPTPCASPATVVTTTTTQSTSDSTRHSSILRQQQAAADDCVSVQSNNSATTGRSSSRGRIRWNENVEELLYRQDPEETDFKKSKPPTSEESSALLQGLLEDEKNMLETTLYPRGSGESNKRKKKKKKQAAVVVDAMELAQQLEQLDKSFVTGILNNVESGFDGLEARFDDFVSFARSVGATSPTVTPTTISAGDGSDQAVVADETAAVVEQSTAKEEDDNKLGIEESKTTEKQNSSTGSSALLNTSEDYVENIEVDYIEKPRILAKLESTPPPSPPQDEAARRFNAAVEFRPKPQPRELPSFEQLPRKRYEARAAAAATTKTPSDGGTPIISNRHSSQKKIPSKITPNRVFDSKNDDNDSVVRDLFDNLTKPAPTGFRKVRSRSLPDHCWITGSSGKQAETAETVDGNEEEKVNLSQLFDEDPFAELRLLNATNSKQDESNSSFMVNNSFMGDSDVTPEVLGGGSVFEDVPLKPKRLDESFSSVSTAAFGSPAGARPKSTLVSVLETESRKEQITHDVTAVEASDESPLPRPSSPNEQPIEKKADGTTAEGTTSLTKSPENSPPTPEKVAGTHCDDTFLSYVSLYWNSLAKEVNSLHRDLSDFSTRLGNEVSSNLQQANEAVMASLSSIQVFEEEKSEQAPPAVQQTNTF